MRMLVAPGNHEDYDLIGSIGPDETGWLPYRSRILLAQRGHRVTIEGVDFVFLGGAGSVDRGWRQREDGRAAAVLGEYAWLRPGKSWWPQEAITDDDVTAAASGGHAAVMITHEAPYPVPKIEDGLIVGQFDIHDVMDAHQVRLKLTKAVDGVRPDLLIHGHHHRRIDDVYVTPDGHEVRVAGMAQNSMVDSIGVLSLPDLSVSRWDGRSADPRC